METLEQQISELKLDINYHRDMLRNHCSSFEDKNEHGSELEYLQKKLERLTNNTK
tara:strand:- start:145 stop:309 length:165 start_codon:yes stop_codon:yes gene_type:complete